MNFSMIFYIAGAILCAESALMAVPLAVSLFYQDGCAFSFLLPIAVLAAVGIILVRRKPENTVIFAREGYVIVAGAWVVMSLFGALPFVISGEIPSYIDALFETVSGFTTTGASILTDVEAMSPSLLFWRSFYALGRRYGRFGFYYGDRAAGRRPFRIFDACGDPGPDSGEVGSQNALYSNDFIWDLRFFDGFGGDPALLWGHASV